MKCTILEKDFQPVWLKLLPPGVEYVSTAMKDEVWAAEILRMEADNNTITFHCRYATETIPARVERRGVAFWPLECFELETNRLLELRGITEFVVDATKDRFSAANREEPANKIPLAVFDDPATAPQDWYPPADYFDQFENPWIDPLSKEPAWGEKIFVITPKKAKSPPKIVTPMSFASDEPSDDSRAVPRKPRMKKQLAVSNDASKGGFSELLFE